MLSAMSKRPSHYRRTAPHGLSPQQERVLSLISAGRTNAEIAALLGVTLDGAKWHVREILTRLDVQTREQAAEWWTTHQSPAARASRTFHALAGVLTWKVAAATAAVSIASGSAALVGLSFRAGPTASASEEVPACSREDVRMETSTELTDAAARVTVWLSIRETPWHQDVLDVLPGLGDSAPERCELDTSASVELYQVGELPDLGAGKPEAPILRPIEGLRGNPTVAGLKVQLRQGDPVPALTAELSNWCGGNVKLGLDVMFPPRGGGEPVVSSSITTGLSALPPCQDPASPQTLTVRTPSPPAGSSPGP
jgi:DNA-binding CsgD family transcriptional regulator